MAGWNTSSILVRNLPPMGEQVLAVKLEIHFGKRSNGSNGDVEGVRLLDLRSGQTTASAVIVFAEERSARSVLGRQHFLQGQQLWVEPYRGTRADLLHPPSSSAVGGSGDEDEDDGWPPTEDDASSVDSFVTASGEDVGNLADCAADPRPTIKLILDGCPCRAQLDQMAADWPASTSLGVDERSGKCTLTGPVDEVMETAARLCSGPRRSLTSPDGGAVSAEQTDRRPAATPVQSVCRGSNPGPPARGGAPPRVVKGVSKEGGAPANKRSRARQLPKAAAKTKPRPVIKASPKLLSYLNTNLACHWAVDAIREEFKVSFEMGAAGTVTVISGGGHQPGMDEGQAVASAVQAMEELIRETEESGLETQVVDVRLVPAAPRDVREAGVRRALQSTQVLVTKRGQDILEFFGTKPAIQEEIQRLRVSLLGGAQSPNDDEPHTGREAEGEPAGRGPPKLNGKFVATRQAEGRAPTDLGEAASSAARQECPDDSQCGQSTTDRNVTTQWARSKPGLTAGSVESTAVAELALPSLPTAERDDATSHRSSANGANSAEAVNDAFDETAAVMPLSDAANYTPRRTEVQCGVAMVSGLRSLDISPKSDQDRGEGFGAEGPARQPGSLRSDQDLIPPGHRGRSGPGDFSVTLSSGMKVTLRQGDLTHEFADVIVTAADPKLCPPAGVGRAVLEAAGPEFVEACQRWVARRGPVKLGESVWTVGGNLMCSHVLNVVPLLAPDGDDCQDSAPETLKGMLVDILETCTHRLQASVVSMPAIGLTREFAPRLFCPEAFLDAVLAINKLCLDGFIRLERLTLVDRDSATVQACQDTFSQALWDGWLLDQCQWDEGLVMSGAQQQTAQGATSDSAADGRAKLAAAAAAAGARGPRGQRQPPGRPDNTCAICLDQIRKERKLRCGHRFCRQCLARALKVDSRCPYCRGPV